MKTMTIFTLWDEIDGYKIEKLYLDKKSAEIALKEHYTDFWINSVKAKVVEIEAVSYFEEDKVKNAAWNCICGTSNYYYDKICRSCTRDKPN